MARRHLHHPLVGLALALSACAELPTESHADPHAAPLVGSSIHTHRQEIRPTQGAGHIGNGYGEVPVTSLASAGGHVRVWYTLEGADAPPMVDTAPADGVPDFVQEVADVADEVVAALEAGGFRLPVRDVDRNDGDFGGDDRFDIYLKNISAGDGYVVAEGCQGLTCSGYLVIENDFRGLSYGSWGEAIRVLVSHEFFHAVQNAYYAGPPAWVSEGQATWHEEHFHREQDDFERLSAYYLIDPKRSLIDRNRGPSDAFAYGAGLFFWSLELAHDDAVIREQLEAMARGEDALAALDTALVKRGDSLASAFARFSVWNIFTKHRAIAGQGYPQSAELFPINLQSFGALDAFNWDLDPEPLSAHHAIFQPSGPVSVEARPLREGDAPPTLVLAQASRFGASGEYTVVAPGQKVVIEHDGQPVYLVALHDGATGRRPGRVQVRAAQITPPPDMGGEPDMPVVDPDMGGEPDMDSAPDMEPVVTPVDPGGEEEGCTAAGGAGVAPVALSLVWALGLVRRRHGAR
jgi:hypothetical protein